MARKDIHRPTEIVPDDYEYLLSFSYPGMSGEPGINLELLRAARTGEPQKAPNYGLNESGQICITGYRDVVSPWGKLPFFDKHEANDGDCGGGCDVCGAHYRHGDAYLHKPSGEVILIGHICGGKMSLHADRGDWTRRQKELAKLRKTAEYRAKKAQHQEKVSAAAIEFLGANAGLREALKVDHYITRDLDASLWRYGRLTEKQVALAMKLHREANEPKPESEAEIMPPAGRVEITGTVVSTKYQESRHPYGSSTHKMLVKVETENGSYRLFGTVPSSIDDEIWNLRETVDSNLALKGLGVTFTATIQPKEDGFGFFSRPAKATVEIPQQMAAAA